MPVISTSTHHNIRFLSFEETKIVKQATVDAIGAQLKDIAESTEDKKIIFDLLGVESMTSMVLGQFVQFRSAVGKRGIAVAFCNVSPEITELLKISRLDALFKIFENREMAMYGFE